MGVCVVDFKKRLKEKKIEKPTDPVALPAPDLGRDRSQYLQGIELECVR
jgi:hypothetical protein